MVEDFLTIKNLLDTLKGKEAKPKDISNLKWKKTNKNAITYIMHWMDISSSHHVANEINTYDLLKKLESAFEFSC